MSTMKADVTAENRLAYSPTSMRQRSGCTRRSAYKYQRVIQIFGAFVDKVVVVIVGHLVKFIVEFDGGVAGRLQMAWKDSWQCFKYGILQAENEREKRG